MADPFVAEIRIVGFNFAPKGWAFCDGQLLPLSQNTALFSLLGTTYGGNGLSNFALPNLQGSFPLHPGQGPGLSLHDLGEQSGTETVTLLESEIPSHGHGMVAGSPWNASLAAPSPSALLGPAPTRPYAAVATTDTQMAPTLATGGGSPHNNMPPYLAMNFIIALQGVFPPRT